MSRIVPIGFKERIFAHPAWALVAAFGTYFCTYGFRKPYTAATYSGNSYFGMDFKVLLVVAQTTGYVLSKWIGIKFVSEIKPSQRIGRLMGLILTAECMLLLFGIVPKPVNIIFLFLNGLSLGFIYGLVLGFLEGRRQTEALIAGLCTSFIVSDGVSKSVGKFLLDQGIPEAWMPFFSGLIFLAPMLIFVFMLSRVSPPSSIDVSARSKREPMSAKARWVFFSKYAPGLIGIAFIHLSTTMLRSIRADFAPEIWAALGFHQTPLLFTQSELIVSLGVIIVNGAAILILNHYKAFRFSLNIILFGLLVMIFSIWGLSHRTNDFTFMVLIGLGIYLPYVAVHTTVFERLISITREHATVGFLMYIVDSIGYTGYMLVLIMRYSTTGKSILSIFANMSLCLGIAGVLIAIFCKMYFRIKLKNHGSQISSLSIREGSHI